jgi:hypothetical protein
MKSTTRQSANQARNTHSYEMVTTPLPGGEIVQELYSVQDDVRSSLHRWVCRTQEAGIRAALVQLGWTPPIDCECGGKVAVTFYDRGDSVNGIHTLSCSDCGREVSGQLGSCECNSIHDLFLAWEAAACETGGDGDSRDLVSARCSCGYYFTKRGFSK